MIRALTFPDAKTHRAKALAGSLYFADAGDGRAALWFFCPCGCGDIARIAVGVSHKPAQVSPSWHWNGRKDAPTLTPSVHQGRCGWHGWLRDGYWESV